VHVDDMLLASPTPAFRAWFESRISQHFEISQQVNDITYLGMSIVKNKDGISVHQRGYIDTLGIKFGIDPEIRVDNPTNSEFLNKQEDEESVDASKYLSLVMSLMYLARFTRPDILMATTYLATKSSKPSKSDYSKLIQILSYVMTTRMKNFYSPVSGNSNFKYLPTRTCYTQIRKVMVAS
jgi:hypothetical protein